MYWRDYILLLFILVIITAIMMVPAPSAPPIVGGRSARPCVVLPVAPRQTIARPIVRVFSSDSAGLMLDAEIVSRILSDEYYIIHIQNKPPMPPPPDKAHMNIFIQNIPFSPKEGIPYPADINCLIPNQEFFTEWDAEHCRKNIDYILCKTWHMCKIFDNKKYYNIRYIGWSSVTHPPPPLSTSACAALEDALPNPFIVHMAGKSWLKGTEYLMRAWYDNCGYARAGAPVDLVVTKTWPYKFGNESRDYMFSLNPHELIICEMNAYVIQLPTGRMIIFGHVDASVRGWLADRALAHACPSLVEGFGHYINEARLLGKPIITTNDRPMNELVGEDGGALVKPLKWVKSSGYISKYAALDILVAIPDVMSMRSAIDGLLKRGDQILAQMGERNRTRALEMHNRLIGHLHEISNFIIIHPWDSPDDRRFILEEISAEDAANEVAAAKEAIKQLRGTASAGAAILDMSLRPRRSILIARVLGIHLHLVYNWSKIGARRAAYINGVDAIMHGGVDMQVRDKAIYTDIIKKAYKHTVILVIQ